MKKILFAIALAVVSTACNNGEECNSQLTEYGISIEATTRTEVSENDYEENKFSLKNWGVLPSINDLKVEIFGNDTTWMWNTLAEFNAENNIPGSEEKNILFPAVPHTITLSYGEEGTEGWSKPYFEGSTTIDIPKFELVAEAQVEVMLTNAVVAIETTDNFNGYFPQSTFKVNGVEWDSTKHELLFMNAGEVTISCEAIRQTGSTSNLESKIVLKPTTRHTILFDLSTAGNTVVNVTLDDEIIETIELEFELNDNA
jgi:hypothetical protein